MTKAFSEMTPFDSYTIDSYKISVVACRPMINPFSRATELKILVLLEGKDEGLYGLEMIRLSDGKLKRGTVYVTLGRLEERGLVRSKIKRDEKHSGLSRPRYTLTPRGQEVLAAWRVILKDKPSARAIAKQFKQS